MEGLQARTDDELLAASVAEPVAFGEFYDRHAHALVGYFITRTRNPEVAADLAAETFAVAALEDLPADQRAAIEARVLADEDYSEIAGRLRLSESVIRKRVSRGLAGLRARIEETPS